MVTGRATNDPRGSARWTCVCDCGNVRVVKSHSLRTATRSCGCLTIEASKSRLTTHGEGSLRGKRTPEYVAWANMISRCENPNYRNYKYWGGRGISVCARWRNSFPVFLLDVGRRPGGQYSLDRFPDPDGNYEPGNVRWATAIEQGNNKSKVYGNIS